MLCAVRPIADMIVSISYSSLSVCFAVKNSGTRTCTVLNRLEKKFGNCGESKVFSCMGRWIGVIGYCIYRVATADLTVCIYCYR